MATFIQTQAGHWKVVIRKRGWPTTIKTFRTKRLAEDWARRTEDEMVRGVYVDRAASERLTLRAALARYLAEVTPTKKLSTQPSNHVSARRLAGELGDYSLAALNPQIISEYRDRRLKDVSPNTVRIELALLGHLYTIAMKEWGLGLVMNPVATIRKPSAGPGRDRRLSEDEEKRLLEACDRQSNPMLGWIVRLAIETGMRKSEITGLRLGDLDLERRVVRLRDTKNAESRSVPLTRTAGAVLEVALDHPLRPTDCDLIFFGEPGRDGVRRPYEFSPSWQEAVKRAGLQNLRFHDLRHEAVSRLVQGGLSDQQVAAISGHKTMQMLRRYTHLRAEDLVVELDRIQQAKTAAAN